jgi:hypothetical protein
MEKVKHNNSSESTLATSTTTPEVSYSPKSNSVTITSNEISILCNQIMTEPGRESSHDFAMIYMSMVSPESDVEAIYLNSCSEDS